MCYCRIVVKCMSDECEAKKKMKVKPGSGISLLSSKTPRESPVLTFPSDGRIAINSTDGFTSYALGSIFRKYE